MPFRAVFLLARCLVFPTLVGGHCQIGHRRTAGHIACLGIIAEIAAEYLRKGSQVYIEGKLRTRKWQDKSGQDRWTTEIIADEMQMLGGRGGAGGGGGGGGGSAPMSSGQDSGPPSTPPQAGPDDFDDDIPF